MVSFFGNRDRELEAECNEYAERKMRACCSGEMKQLVESTKTYDRLKRRVTNLQSALYGAVLAGHSPRFLEARTAQFADQLYRLGADIEALDHFLDLRYHEFFRLCYEGEVRPA
jgi:hypothetical protein